MHSPWWITSVFVSTILTSTTAKLGSTTNARARSNYNSGLESDCPYRCAFALNKGWKQHTTFDSPSISSNGCASSGTPECRSDYDDTHWKSVSIPHDFVVEGLVNETTNDKDHGYFPLGYSWYRKRFAKPAFHNKTWRLELEGCMWRCHVYLNHRYLGNSTTGYLPFWFDVTLEQENVLVVMADATHPDSWWYDGGGLYRHVRLVALNDIHFAKFGIYAPSFVQSAIQAETQHDPARADAVVIASVEVERYRNAGDAIIVVFEVLNEVNQIVASEKIIHLGGSDVRIETVGANVRIENAKLWSIVHPSLYTLQTSLVSAANGDVFDLERTTFGIRKLHWDPDLGFFINDVNTKILGVANHQDFAGLGVAIPDSLQAHRIAKIQELGGNAWRTAHNAPNVALLDATDRMGMLVWDENHRNGEVENAKLLVKRDRNHPSIIIWSICNEILCDCGDGVASKISLEKAVEIKDAMQTLDPHGQRVISANQNEWIMENSVLDLLGFDYATNNYDFWHALLPTFPAISSETSSALSDRGEYEDNQASGHVSAFDTQIVPWGQTTEKAWGGYDPSDLNNTQGILTRRFIAGGFTWTGFDYKGEPTPYAWPDISSHFGIYDIAGFDKDRVGWYKSWWPLENNKPHVDCLFLFPHWNWALNNAEAQRNRHLHLCESNACVVEVRVYSNAACVELFLNGQTQGRQAMPRYGFLAWNVTFAPGNITARSYASCGDVDIINEVARVTTGPPAKLRASFKDSVGADGINADEVALIQVVVLDAFDRLVPVPNEYPVLVRFEVVAGAGKVIGTGNGDPADLTCDKSPIRKAYHGRLLGIVQGDEVEFGKPGDIEVVVSADGFDDVLVAISLVRSNPTRTSL